MSASTVTTTTPAPGKSRHPYDTCPLCSASDISELRTGDCSHHALYKPVVSPLMVWMRCGACEHVFTEGYFTDEARAEVFSSTHPNEQPGADFEQNRYVSARIVERVARYVSDGTGTATWLDAGSGNGSLLFTAEEWGFRPEGLVLRPATAQGLRALGIDAHCADLTALDGSGRYSVISLTDVLEHMPYPGRGLAAAHRLLREDGVLFASMPSYGCAAWRLLDARNANPYWGELEHFHNFSRARLYSLLEEHGFEPLHYAVSERHRVGMEVVARRRTGPAPA
ncbi:class I SAM-dependent methyltransferase [Streptomyces sp. NPDC096339]|uniref:class I SAM-dependent methyltransferase n=1 Tax=Streptomyces sp. NPDC096339 TaxID=3366086 RepID=UPI00380EF4C1